MHEVTVVGVRVELPASQPIVLLKESDGERYLPIWIGAVEATAIAFAQQGVTTMRPMTHDLMRDMLTELGRPLRRVVINDCQDGIYYASLVFDDGVEVSARPSDAIALAIRTGSQVFCVDEVLDASGILVPEEQGAESETQRESEVERFREFLDTISPEDFDAGS
ncbi:MAG TPA: bifunctional nuclease family protein [Mycobacteriales bacterium]